MPEDQEKGFNQIVKSQQQHDLDDDMNNSMKKIATAAEQTIPDNKVHNGKQDCDPEVFRVLKICKEVVMRGNDDNIKETTKIIQTNARRIRTKKFVKGFKENKWDLIKNTKKDTHLNTQRCETSMEILLTTGKEPKP